MRERERGAALVLALVTCAIVLALVFALHSASLRDSAGTSGTLEQQRARLTAQAGVWAMANHLSQGGQASAPDPGDQVAIAGNALSASYAVQTMADPDGDGTATPLADGDGDGLLDFSHRSRFEAAGFEVRAVRESGDVFRVMARAVSARAPRTLEVWLDRQSAGFTPFRRAVFSEQQLLVHSEVFTDSYDPVSIGPYAAHVKYQAFDDNGDPAMEGGLPVFLASTTGLPGGAKGEVASNAGITLWSGGFVFGDARPGPGQSVDLGGTGENHVEGITAPMSQPLVFPLPAFAPPSGPQNAALGLPAPTAPLDLSGGALTIDVRGQGPVQLAFPSVSLKSGATLTVLGDPGQRIELHLTDPIERALELDSASRILIAPGGQAVGPVLEVLSRGGLDLNADSSLNESGDPTQLRFWSSLDDPSKVIRLNSKSTSQCVLYAPGAGIDFNSKCEFFGAVVGARVRFNSKLRFHYDESLAGVTMGPAAPPLWVPRATREVR